MVRLLLDTYSIFFRAFHALPAMNTADGTPTNAVYGLCVLLLKLLREESPCEVAFAIDAGGANPRALELPEYKQNRAPLPDALRPQFALLDELIDAFGFPGWKLPGAEADDVLATLARELEREPAPIVIASGDRDLFQLVRERTQVLFLGRRGAAPERYDRARVVARFGVEPEQLPSYVALVGDTSDNIPKIPGIGPRTAAQLVARYGSASAVLEHLGELPERVRATLAGHAEAFLRNERIVRLNDRLELGEGPRTAALDAAAIARCAETFERFEFRSLVPRLEKLRAQLR